MMSSNCSGTKGKHLLDPERLRVIREAVFEKWPIKPNQEEQAVWVKECIIAIDEACRRLNRGEKD